MHPALGFKGCGEVLLCEAWEQKGKAALRTALAHALAFSCVCCCDSTRGAVKLFQLGGHTEEVPCWLSACISCGKELFWDPDTLARHAVRL